MEGAFTYASPYAWNSLPKDLRAVSDLDLFMKRLQDPLLVWLTVSADNTDDSVMHTVIIGAL